MDLKKGQLRSVNLRKKNYQHLRDLWDTIKQTYAQQESQKKKEKSRKNIWKNNDQNSPNFMKNINLYIQKTQWTPGGKNSEIPHLHKLKLLKDKDKIFKAPCKKCLIKRSQYKITTWFLIRNHVRRKTDSKY